MRVQNVNSQDNNDYYEILVICRNDSEMDYAWKELENDSDLILDSCDELGISVCVPSIEFDTKRDFEIYVRGCVK